MTPWYYMQEDTQVGPIAHDEIKGLAESGEITRDTLVWAEGWPEWKAAGDVLALFPAPAMPDVPSSPTPIPPPPADSYGPSAPESPSRPAPPIGEAAGSDPVDYTTIGVQPTGPGVSGSGAIGSGAAGPGMSGPVVPISNHLVKAILVTLFCCIPFGIVSIVKAAQVNARIEAGNQAEAIRLSQSANTWANWGFWIGLGSTIAWRTYVFIGGLSS